MRNPLMKRLPRELKGEPGRYLAVFLLLVGTIGFVSGFLVADNSMIIAYRESFEKYNIEDGHFRLAEEANRALLKKIRSFGVGLYENFYVEEELDNGSTLRVFSDREEVNRVCLMEGALPERAGEAAIDRMYADNNHIRVGDTLTGPHGQWLVTGLVALPDYSCLFADNSDTMFDAVKFGVAVIGREAFAGYGEKRLNYSYSWKYLQSPADEKAEREMSEELMKQIGAKARLEDYVPRYLNQAIQFTGEDMGSDKAMMIALLYILIVIIAFVFGITMGSTVSREANVIGTLLASGFRRGELFRHYMAAPLCVTAAGALAGNILGYTVFRTVCAGMYYGSYSLPTYVTVWNGEAFFLTTVIPLLLMAAVSGVVLWWKLRLPPLRFLRRDIAGSGRRRALPLPAMIPFFGRFRVRVILQNISNYMILLVGILFANLLLMFGLLLPAVLVHHQEEMEQNMLCPYQYILRPPLGTENEERRLEGLLAMLYFYRMVETDQESAEKFSAWTLNTLEGAYKSEEVLLYGIDRDSRYISLEVGGDEVYISSAYADKFGIGPGDTVTLKEPYEDTQYSFTVTGIYDYNGALALFMGREYLNKTFDLDGDYFGGYFSDTEIQDIDSEYIGSVIDLDALTKISRQLMVSMGSMMYLVDGFAIVMFAAIMYLLSKIIIEKNAQSISMAKILGYTDREIMGLYILPTLSVTVFFLIATMPVEYGVMAYIFRVIMMNSISGWIPLYVDPVIYVKMFFLGLLACGAVTALEYRRVGRVPMGEALKNVE